MELFYFFCNAYFVFCVLRLEYFKGCAREVLNDFDNQVDRASDAESIKKIQTQSQLLLTQLVEKLPYILQCYLRVFENTYLSTSLFQVSEKWIANLTNPKMSHLRVFKEEFLPLEAGVLKWAKDFMNAIRGYADEKHGRSFALGIVKPNEMVGNAYKETEVEKIALKNLYESTRKLYDGWLDGPCSIYVAMVEEKRDFFWFADCLRELEYRLAEIYEPLSRFELKELSEEFSLFPLHLVSQVYFYISMPYIQKTLANESVKGWINFGKGDPEVEYIKLDRMNMPPFVAWRGFAREFDLYKESLAYFKSPVFKKVHVYSKMFLLLARCVDWDHQIRLSEKVEESRKKAKESLGETQETGEDVEEAKCVADFQEKLKV